MHYDAGCREFLIGCRYFKNNATRGAAQKPKKSMTLNLIHSLITINIDTQKKSISEVCV